jgi:hypothetical protein
VIASLTGQRFDDDETFEEVTWHVREPAGSSGTGG